MRKKSDTVHYTAKPIRSKIGRGEDRTNWNTTNAVTGAKLEESIRADVDDLRSEARLDPCNRRHPSVQRPYQHMTS